MEHNYRYLQQATIPPVKSWNPNRGILGNLDCAYMGSAEFEFGALPIAMGRLLGSADALVFGKTVVELPVDRVGRDRGVVSVTLRYLVRQDQETKLVAFLQDWKAASKHFKEWNVGLTKPNDLVFCIDKDYEALIWNGKLGKRLIQQYAVSSLRLLVENERCPAVPAEILTRLEAMMAPTKK